MTRAITFAAAQLGPIARANHFPLGGDSDSGTPVQPGVLGPDTVDGTIALTVQTVKASGVLEPAASGNFEVSTPTVTIGSIVN